jgi:hypothetical protein
VQAKDAVVGEVSLPIAADGAMGVGTFFWEYTTVPNTINYEHCLQEDGVFFKKHKNDFDESPLYIQLLYLV